MLGALLRYFETDVALVDNSLVHTVYLMPENERIAASFLWGEILQVNAAFHLFETADCVTVALQLLDASGRGGMICPGDRVFRSEGCLVDFGGGWTLANAAKGEPLHGKSIARAENGTDIVKAADVVEHNRKLHFRLASEVLDVGAVKVAYCFLLHYI